MAEGIGALALLKLLWKPVAATGGWVRRRFYRRKVGHFVTPEQYYQRYLGTSAKQSTISHDYDIVGRNAELDCVLEVLDSGEGSVTHIIAPPGHGKSRFALELSRLMRGHGRGFRWYLGRKLRGRIWTVYFPRRDSLGLVDHVDELRKKSNVAIFLDDSHLIPDQVRALANYAGLSAPEGEIHLLCFSRSTMSDVTIDALAEVPAEKIRELALRQLDKPQIAEMISTFLPTASEDLRDKILRFTQESAFLTAMVCQLVRNGVDFADVVTEQQFRRRVCDLPLEEAVSHCGVSVFAALRTAAILAAASPVNYTDENIRAIARELSGVTDAEFDCVVEVFAKRRYSKSFPIRWSGPLRI